MIKYKPIGENLGDGMRELGGNIRSVPHIVIGKKPEPPNPNSIPTSSPIFSPKEEKLISNVKKWAFVLAMVLVIGYAAYQIFF